MATNTRKVPIWSNADLDYWCKNSPISISVLQLMQGKRPNKMRLKIKVILNTLRPKRNGYHNSDDSFLNKNVWISIKIPLKFVLLCLINNIAALVQIMTWRRSGDKPLSEPMMVSLLTHICVTQPQWVECKVYWFRNTIGNSRSCQCRHIHFFLLPFRSTTEGYHLCIWPT